MKSFIANGFRVAVSWIVALGFFCGVILTKWWWHQPSQNLAVAITATHFKALQ